MKSPKNPANLLTVFSRFVEFARGDASARAIVLLFAIIAFIGGTGYAVLMFPLQPPDETAHLLRAWATSEITCRGSSPTAVPTAILEMNRLFPAHIEDHPSSQLLAQNALHHVFESRSLDAQTALENNYSGNLYSCVPYLPAATVWWAGKRLHVGVLPVFYVGRIINVIVYTALGSAAIWFIPAFRLLLAAVALLPMTLHQVGSYSADSTTLALSFLFFAFCMYLAFGPVSELRVKHCAVLIVLGALLALCKFNAWMLLLTILIPARRFRSLQYRFAFITVLLVFISGLVVAWQIHNRRNVAYFQQFRLAQASIDFSANAQVLTHEPTVFLQAFTSTLQQHPGDIVAMFVGRLGPLSIPLPPWIIIGTIALLIVSLIVHDGTRVHLRLSHRALLVLISVASFVSVYAVLWTFETTATGLQQARSASGIVSGFQGRYVLPFAPLLLVGLSWCRFRLTRITAVAVITFIGVCQATALGIVYRTYHFVPEASRFEGQLVRRPGSTPEDSKVYVVSEGGRHWVLDGGWMERYGYKPGDIQVISAEELSRIPERKAVSTNMSENGVVLRLPVKTAGERYEGKVVHYRAVNKLYLIARRTKHWVLHSAWLETHGYKSRDIVAISSEELESIPEGEPIP